MAARRAIPNSPSLEHWASLKSLSENILEPARAALGPLHITSGYRSPTLNYAVGGSTTSQHMHGEAADVIPFDCSLGDLYRWVYDHAPYWQLIFEFSRWCHVSYKAHLPPAREALIATKLNGRTVYTAMTREQVETL